MAIRASSQRDHLPRDSFDSDSSSDDFLDGYGGTIDTPPETLYASTTSSSAGPPVQQQQQEQQQQEQQQQEQQQPQHDTNPRPGPHRHNSYGHESDSSYDPDPAHDAIVAPTALRAFPSRTASQTGSPHLSHAYSQSDSFSPFEISRQSSPGHVRSQTVAAFAGASVPSLHIIKRKPISSTASPAVTSRSQSPSSTTVTSPRNSDLKKPETRFSRNYSLDSPTLYGYPERTLPSLDELTQRANRSDDRDSVLAQQNTTTDIGRAQHTDPRDSPLELRRTSLNRPSLSQPPLHASETIVIVNADEDSDKDSDKDSISSGYSEKSRDKPAMSIVVPKSTPPHLNLEKAERSSDISTPPTTAIASGRLPEINKPLPRSPTSSSSKFGSFFNWAVSPSASITEFSPLPSPSSARDRVSADAGTFSNQRKSSKTNASFNPLGLLESTLLTPPPLTTTSPPPPSQIEEMEDELKAISVELAASIRREMDLEDLVDRLQSEISNPQAPSKRTSDYFSDSGVSSTKFGEYDQNKEEVERIQRRAEQEKASIRLELTNKLQDERLRRTYLDQQIQELSEKAAQVDLAQLNSSDVSGRVKDLENTCEDLRRRLSEERKLKENFEDLLSALKGEYNSASSERDNLKDEIVPQLRARLEGLETEAAEYANLTYESTKLQQELQTLRTENKTLRLSKQPLAEEQPPRPSAVLSRSNSVTATTGSPRYPKPPGGGLSRSNTVKGGAIESREALAERLKDVEAQRDALHNALKSLLDRQEYQNRENEKRIRVLEMEKERLLTGSPGTPGFGKDVSTLRHEVKVLRRRAEEAIEHKWEAEKGLAGLKMDLDRAEEEIASLRSLLNEKDILIPPLSSRSSTDSVTDASPVSSESLQKSFRELQESHQQALDKIKTLEAENLADEKTQLALEKYEQLLSTAIFERDDARQQDSASKAQLESLRNSEAQYIVAERALAEELDVSSRRVEELANQVRGQLQANADLRKRLADTVARGDEDRKTNVERIASLQRQLRSLEERLINAQTSSEERVAHYEDQMKDLKESNSLQLQRLLPSPPNSSGFRSPFKGFSAQTSPMFPLSPRSPRNLPKMSIDDEVQVDKLRSRVSELERVLAEADSEMQEVIGRMSEAQMEVLTLQEEREMAVRETRRLQKTLQDERVKSFEERFRTLSN